ncbi:MAG TPA: phosphoribosylformylglycinamidine cyclo-ligase [bacterium]|nr:phosphoribosylformylglycinamidine cyclo-ligase [bacterium]
MRRPRASPLTYRRAGVDRDAKDAILAEAISRIRSTHGSETLGVGDTFGGLFRLSGYRYPVLVSSIDGVGTKVRVAEVINRWQVVGGDIVAHGANDVLCQGATPLFMLDYIAAASLRPGVVTAIIDGMAQACREQGIALIGGETAEMPGVYAPGGSDVVGCTVGVVERDRMITGDAIRPGDAIVGLASNGLHTNGYSLARAALLPTGRAAARRALDRRPGGLAESLADALLRPHRPYARAVLALRERTEIHGIAHITGGGLAGNLVRILPQGCRATIVRGRWSVPPIFPLIQRRGRVDDAEMFRTFNMGLGMLLVVPGAMGDAAAAHLDRLGERASVVGGIAAGPRGVAIGG